MNGDCLENDDFRLPEAQLQLQPDPNLLGNQRADGSACCEVILIESKFIWVRMNKEVLERRQRKALETMGDG